MKKLIALLLAATMMVTTMACGEGQKAPVDDMKNPAGETQKQEESKDTEPATPEAPAEPEVGGTVLFGSYEQDGNPENGAELIEWEILDEDETGFFLKSKYVLDAKLFHEVEETAHWEQSTIRQWLNNDFYNTAFTTEDKAAIRLSQVSNQVEANSEYNKKANGNPTEDYVYLLSTDELEKYYPYDGSASVTASRRMYATEYAKDHQITVGATTRCVRWLLRTVYEEQTNAAVVERDTSVSYTERHGKYTGIYGIMPVMWVEKADFVPAQGEKFVAQTGEAEYPTEDYTSATGITYTNLTKEELFEHCKELYPVFSQGQVPAQEQYVQLVVAVPAIKGEKYNNSIDINMCFEGCYTKDETLYGAIEVSGSVRKNGAVSAESYMANATVSEEEFGVLCAKYDLLEAYETFVIRGKIVDCRYDAEYDFYGNTTEYYNPYVIITDIEKLR